MCTRAFVFGEAPKKLDQKGGQGLSVEKNEGTNRSGPIVRQPLGDLGSGAGHGNY